MITAFISESHAACTLQTT